MFEENTAKEPLLSNKKPRYKSTAVIALGAAIILLVGVAGLLAYKILSMPGYTIPEHIIKDTPYAIFVPKKLPGGYKVVDGSFSVSEGGLVFRADDADGSSIAFSEQKTPDNFDFEKFYKEKMEGAKKLDKAPYPSVVGRLPDGGDKTLLSINAGETWILVSTAAPLGEQDFIAIAKGIKQY